jgi:hypothetical protein
VKYDPLAILSATFDHLRENPVGHIKLSLVLFFVLQGVIWGTMCFGGFGMVAGLIATDGDKDAQLALMMLFYLGIFGILCVLLPPVMFFYYGYQKATLDEVDGKGPVGPGVAAKAAMSMLGAIIPLMAVQCGASIVGMLMCYVGVFFTSVPLRYAFLIKADRDVPVMDAVALAWEGFWAKPGAHLLSMLVVFLVAMVFSYIPLVGPMIVWPMMAVFEAKSYRALYGGPGAVSEAALGTPAPG